MSIPSESSRAKIADEFATAMSEAQDMLHLQRHPMTPNDVCDSVGRPRRCAVAMGGLNGHGSGWQEPQRVGARRNQVGGNVQVPLGAAEGGMTE